MHMKKKILLISSVLFTLFIVVISVFINNKNNTNNLVLENKEEIKEQISGFNGIAMESWYKKRIIRSELFLFI